MNKTINIIAAVDQEFGFGRDGRIPWHYPEDFKFFQKMTKGNTVIMVRKTFDDLWKYKKPDTQELLPKRQCIVVTSQLLPHQKNYQDGYRGITLECKYNQPYENIHRVSTISDALNKAKDLQGDIFYIGGESIFDSGLNMADCVYLTQVPGNHGCDRFFPAKKLNENFQIYNTKEGNDGLIFHHYVHKIWGKYNPHN